MYHPLLYRAWSNRTVLAGNSDSAKPTDSFRPVLSDTRHSTANPVSQQTVMCLKISDARQRHRTRPCPEKWTASNTGYCLLDSTYSNYPISLISLIYYISFSIIRRMNRLNSETRTRVVSCLLEACSVRSTVRLTGAAKKTVLRLLVEVGDVCAAYHDTMVRDLSCKRVQMDEVWTFNYCKAKQLTPEIAAKHPGAGDVWLWVALCADSRLALSWRVGLRDSATAQAFVEDVASRLSQRPQITSDSLHFYRAMIERVFGSDVDFATLTKHYSAQDSGRFSPPRFIGATREVIKGDPDPAHIATSYVERSNWSARTTMRRYTRLSNGFSRKLRNHEAAVNLNYFAYNFVRLHKSLRMSPAMAAGVTNRLWEVSDIVALLEAAESKKAA